MIDRRDVLAMLGKVSAMGTGRLLFKLTGSPSGGEAQQSNKGAAGDFDERVAAEMSRLSSRVYSEEGIPMLLACENLVPPATAGKTPVLPTTAFNKVFSSAFHRYAVAWQRLHPDATEDDVPKVLELLADLDFAAGGKETAL